ncbi:NAD-dependent epimerase/dehydratase family protein [Sagittula sp. SSi028]|uniref:NAD-dependent epimerase/dehydratase family protein n=1 Tax=Sagittula sp. SSi028 TaxID=3400636 RepID=UPI003AF8B35A
MSSAVVITGANGFVGRACVACARQNDIPVVAIVRSTPLAQWQGDSGITVVRLDLTQPDAADRLAAAIPVGAAVIHAAAHLGDDPDRLAADTLGASASVLHAVKAAQARLVLISSLTVYDTDRLSPGDRLDENSPLIAAGSTARDAYAGAKRVQETLFADLKEAWFLRAGAIWGPHRSWHALQGFWASKLFVTIGSDGELPLVHVDHLARTAITAAGTAAQGVHAVNVFDDDLPDRARFLRAHRATYGWPRINVTVPYQAWAAMARGLRPIAHHLPGLFREPVLRARVMPLRFPNDGLRAALGGADSAAFEAMMTRTHAAEAPVTGGTP